MDHVLLPFVHNLPLRLHETRICWTTWMLEKKSCRCFFFLDGFHNPSLLVVRTQKEEFSWLYRLSMGGSHYFLNIPRSFRHRSDGSRYLNLSSAGFLGAVTKLIDCFLNLYTYTRIYIANFFLIWSFATRDVAVTNEFAFEEIDFQNEVNRSCWFPSRGEVQAGKRWFCPSSGSSRWKLWLAPIFSQLEHSWNKT